jgi:hypothetical protein
MKLQKHFEEEVIVFFSIRWNKTANKTMSYRLVMDIQAGDT